MNNIASSAATKFKRLLIESGKATFNVTATIELLELYFKNGEMDTLNSYFGDRIETYNIAVDLVHNSPHILTFILNDPNFTHAFKTWFFDRLDIDPETLTLKTLVV